MNHKELIVYCRVGKLSDNPQIAEKILLFDVEVETISEARLSIKGNHKELCRLQAELPKPALAEWHEPCLLVYADDDSKTSIQKDQSIWNALRAFKVTVTYDGHLDLLKVTGSNKELDKILTAGLPSGVQIEKDGTFTALKE